MISTESEKGTLARGLASIDKNSLSWHGPVNATLHGVSTSWYLPSIEVKVQLESYLNNLSLAEPRDKTRAAEPLSIYWYPHDLAGVTSEEIWESDADPDCRISGSIDQEIAIQRDFIAAMENSNVVRFISPLRIGDGFHNFLRWLLPRKMLERNCALIHSSAIRTASGKAHLFLGPSGAGKTTLSSFAPIADVLGDDMNVLAMENGVFSVVGGVFGQKLQNQKLIGRAFPIGSVCWLKQGPSVAVRRLTRSEAYLDILSCFANLFWERLDGQAILKVQSLVTKLVEHVPTFEIEFNLQGEVWNNVIQRIEEH